MTVSVTPVKEWPSIFDRGCVNGFPWCSGPDNRGEPAEFLNGKCDDCFRKYTDKECNQ